MKSRTLIAYNYSELAQNEQLVRAILSGNSVLVLVDSGSESNIVDASL